MQDWPYPCVACQHPAHRGGECPQCACTHIPFARTIERQWIAFRYRDGSAWQIPGREGRWLIVRVGDEHALLRRYDRDGVWLAVADASVFDLMPCEEEE